MDDGHTEDATRYWRVRGLFEAAESLPEDQRETYLCRECGDDTDLLRQVRRLLSHHEEATDFLGHPALEGVTLDSELDAGGLAAWERFLDQLESRGPAWRRYTDEGELARGGMGAIRRVKDEDLRRTLAMKVILAHDATTDSATRSASLGRFLEEAQVTSQLDHPGVVPVHEIGVDDRRQVYFTMKLIEGQDLRAVFRRVHEASDPEWNQTRAIDVMVRVCEAMAYAHAKGVIHRDLKPANVMVGRYGETYVMDWGLARILGQQRGRDIRLRPAETSSTIRSERSDATPDQSSSPLMTMDGDVVGTPAYMAPEQAEGRLQDMGPHSDIYAVGAMLYHLLTGTMPYVDPDSAASPHAILVMLLHGPPEPLHRINPAAPAELQAICEKAMARSTADRYQTMEDLARDLRAYLEQRVVVAYESGALAELRKWIARNRGLTMTMAAAFLIIVSLTVWFVLSVKEKEQLAVDEKARVMRVSDAKRLDNLLLNVEQLWPLHPDRVGDMKSWLDRARILLERRSEHEETLRSLRAKGTALQHHEDQLLSDLRTHLAADQKGRWDRCTHEGDRDEHLDWLRLGIATVGARTDRERSYDFGEDTESEWWHDTLRDLIVGLQALAEDDLHGATVAGVERRLDIASNIRERSIESHREAWNEAIASIANIEACPVYGGLKIEPQIGLVPIGRDPNSGLWEFWHVQTGEAPVRNTTGLIALTEATGVVLVLIPGGTSLMGSQSVDPARPNYHEKADAGESNSDGAPVAVTLAPYFLSKFEMTQSQWIRVMGSNPSIYNATFDFQSTSFLHPVEQVTWNDCQQVAFRTNLVLPTEAQWERACRAGTSTTWHFGDDTDLLPLYANLRDESYAVRYRAAGICEPWDDGHGVLAAVGSMRPNQYGLYDMIGNVWEWCLDDFLSYDTPARPGDGARINPYARGKITRGAAFTEVAELTHSSNRDWNTAGIRALSLGVRFARPVD